VKTSLHGGIVACVALLAVNARFRYNPRERNDLYIVWNESLNSVAPLTQERAILVKYSHTLTLGL
jgi:hypothetical protein